MIRKYQVYGERCCGTNYIIRLLERNITDAQFTEEYGFKHWFVDEGLQIPDDTLVIVIERDLVKSLQSLHRKPWHVHESLKGLSFSEFIRKEWHCVWDESFWGIDESHPDYMTEMMHERDPVTGERFENVVRMRAAKLANWKRLGERCANFGMIRYEDVRKDPEGFVTELAGKYSLERIAEFDPVTNYKGLSDKPFVPKEYAPVSDADWGFIEAEYARGS